MKYVNDAVIKAKQLDGKGRQKNEESVLEMLLQIDQNCATHVVSDMIFAGIDTTSSAVASLLYQLALNPEKQNKLIEEVFTLLPEVDSPLNKESLNNSPYFRACLKESMRMNPVIPGLLRASGQDIIIAGYQIPKMVSEYTTIKVLYRKINLVITDRLCNDSYVNRRVVLYKCKQVYSRALDA